MEKKNRLIWIIIGGLAVILLIWYFTSSMSLSFNHGKKIAYSELETQLKQMQKWEQDNTNTITLEDKNTITDIYFSDGLVEVLYKGSKKGKSFPKRSDAYCFINSSYDIAQLKTLVSEINNPTTITAGRALAIELTNNNINNVSWFSIILSLLPYLILGILIFFFYTSLSNSNRSAMSFSRTKAQVTNQVKVRFDDVAGSDEEKEELMEIVGFLKAPKKFFDIGAKIPKGVLLVGPPGTGKTLFAKAVAGEANVPFFSISGSDFVEMFVGVGASRVRSLFEQAKASQPCIIFIDEIDAVGRQRGAGLGGGHDEREQTLNQLLVQMDGFESNESIIVIAATNRADVLDPALLRPGRFDRQIFVNIPDVRDRELIFKVHAKHKPLSPEINYKTLARITSGFTGADIANVLNEASILCARDDRKMITMQDINEAINKTLLGPQKKSRIITEIDKRITAYHESGHAIVARCLPSSDPVHEVSIIPRGQAAGYTMTRPNNDNQHMSISKLEADLAVKLGGRVAEELIIKDITTGASNDIKTATQIARKMVTEWGMSSSIGPVYYGSSGEIFLGRDYSQTHNTISENSSQQIDKEIKKLLDVAHNTATKILTEHKTILDKMVRLLIERETIFEDEIDMLFDGKSVDDIMDQMDKKQNNKNLKSDDPFDKNNNKDNKDNKEPPIQNNISTKPTKTFS